MLCDSTETALRLHCKLFAVELQSESLKYESGIRKCNVCSASIAPRGLFSELNGGAVI